MPLAESQRTQRKNSVVGENRRRLRLSPRPLPPQRPPVLTLILFSSASRRLSGEHLFLGSALEAEARGELDLPRRLRGKDLAEGPGIVDV